MALEVPDKSELVALFKKASADPLPFAFGIGKDAKSSALLVHKSRGGQQLLTGLRSERSDIKKGLFGTVKVEDKVASFICEKEASGAARLIKGNLKSLGLNYKVRVLGPDGAVLEEEAEEEQQAGGATAGSGATAEATTEAPPGKGRLEGKLVAFQKSRLIWQAARKKVEGQLGDFRKAAVEEFDGDDDADEALAALDQLDELLVNFDESLADRLDDMQNATDEGEREKIAADAKKILVKYLTYLKSNPLVAQLEGETPLGVNLSIGSTLTASLQAIAGQLK